MTEVLGVLAAVVSSALGGTSIGATRFLVDAIDPLAIGSFRFGIGFLLLLPVALVQGAWPPREDWPGVGAWPAFLRRVSVPVQRVADLHNGGTRRAGIVDLPLLTMLVGAALGSEAVDRAKTPAC